MNRKITLIIILATILALGIVLLIIELSKEPLPIENTTQKEMKEEVLTVEPEKTEVKEGKDVFKKVETVKPIKKVVKKTETVKSNPVEIKSETVQLESTVVTEGIPEEKDIVIPVKYTSKNIYKYVYTPARFKK